MQKKKVITADKGIDVCSVAEQVQEDTLEILNKNFEAINGTLKQKTKITIIFDEVGKNE